MKNRRAKGVSLLARTATVSRSTLETCINVDLDIDAPGPVEVSTGVGMLDHLITSLAFHSGFSLKMSASCQGFQSQHHLTEDAGIVLGEALRKALGDGSGISRFGSAAVPMDDALVMAAVDFGGRSHFQWDVPVAGQVTDGFDCRLAQDFFVAMCLNARMALHLRYIWGTDPHHLLESCFKATAVAFRTALAPSRGRQGPPSTKGTV